MKSIILVGLFLCPPDGVIDRIEEHRAVVLGSTGVHVIATAQIQRGSTAPLREGDRIVRTASGRCLARPATQVETETIRKRLRVLELPAPIPIRPALPTRQPSIR
jgi:hypothetical protein